MVRGISSLGLVLALLATPAAAEEAQWSIALHGGAGVIERASLTPEQDAAYRAALGAALEAGSAVLRRGGSSLDAVQAAIELMEDDPLFNAGRGAVFTAEGRNEMDAAVMNGADLAAGSVAGVTRTRHPIALARAVMERSPHVMLAGEGANAFSAAQGLEQAEPSWFFTERRWTALVQLLTQRGEPIPPRPDGVAPSPQADIGPQPPLNERKFGTVGVVALDQAGHLAAGTSTGGTTGKRWGRIGDAPVIGAGTYASDADGCAVSATGTGEYFIRATVARDVCARTGAGAALAAAADAEIAEVGALRGEGGLIALDRQGGAAFSMNTSGMYRAAASSTRAAWVAIYADEARPAH
ncbi:MAG TPA: isoaspartyl peptidase/L-asparaginase [Caulobacteraceae bacterium]